MEYRPWTWKVPETSADMKRTIKRQDAFERVSGQAVFTRDVNLPGMLYAKILNSPYAHARIKSIDKSAAEDLMGVRDILVFDDPDIEFDNETLPGFEASRKTLDEVPKVIVHGAGPSGTASPALSRRTLIQSLTLSHAGLSSQLSQSYSAQS